MQDVHSPVELFYENEAYHLVGKGHARERQLFLGSFVDSLGEAIRSSDDEDQTLADCIHFAFHVIGKFYGAHFFSTFVQQHDEVSWLKCFQYQFSFFFLLYVGAEVPSILQFGDDFHVECKISFGALHVVVDGCNEVGLYGAPHDE